MKADLTGNAAAGATRLFRSGSRKRYVIGALILAPLLLGDCNICGGGSVIVKLPPSFKGPFNVTVKGTGRTGPGGESEIGTTAKITFDGTSVSWEGTGSGVGTGDPGNKTGSATGTVTDDPADKKKHKITVDMKVSGGRTLHIEGELNEGPPQSGSGSWNIIDSDGKTQLGSGTWSF